jgi:hypothetical protein
MKTLTRTTALTLAASLTLLVATAAQSAPPKALLISPPPSNHLHNLPKFGFRSYTLNGVGEVVTYVRPGSLAWKMGVERGDIFYSINHERLTYHGAWNNALAEALASGNQVHLHIIDRNTGRMAQRDVYFGGFGGWDTPHVVGYGGSGNSYLVNHDECYDDHFGYPSGPVTYKSMAGPQKAEKKNKSGKSLSLNDIAKLFDKD